MTIESSADGQTASLRYQRRGLLDIKINLSNPEPTAGSDFTVYVLVTNPFDVPIWLFSPQVFLPSEIRFSVQSFQDSVQNLSFLLSQAAEGKVEPLVDDGLQRFLRFGRASRMKDILKLLARRAVKLSARVAVLENKLDAVEREKKAHLEGKSFAEQQAIFQNKVEFQYLTSQEADYLAAIADTRSELNALVTQVVVLCGGSSVIAEGDLSLSGVSPGSRIYVQAKGDVDVRLATTQLATLISSLDLSKPLQPGDTIVFSIVLSTTQTLFFRPIQYVLQYSLNFSFLEDRSILHTNTCAQTLTIRAPILSVMVGASLGGLAGAVANILQTLDQTGETAVLMQTNPLQIIITVVISVILSAMAVVFLARKSDTQSLVSVEDFWGGLVIGFLVGYTGTSVFDSLGLDALNGTVAPDVNAPG